MPKEDVNWAILQRITVAEVIENEWFKKGYQPPRFETPDVNLDDVNDIFNESGVFNFSILFFGNITILLQHYILIYLSL